MEIILLAPKVVRSYLAEFPEVTHNAYKYFNYDHRVVQERVPRGDPKIPYYAPKDFTDEMYGRLVKYACSLVNPVLTKYSQRVACEDALNTAIRSYEKGFFDGKINANCFQVLLESMLSNVKTAAKKRERVRQEERKQEEKHVGPGLIHQLGLKMKNIPQEKPKKRKEDILIVKKPGGKVVIK